MIETPKKNKRLAHRKKHVTKAPDYYFGVSAPEEYGETVASLIRKLSELNLIDGNKLNNKNKGYIELFKVMVDRFKSEYLDNPPTAIKPFAARRLLHAGIVDAIVGHTSSSFYDLLQDSDDIHILMPDLRTWLAIHGHAFGLAHRTIQEGKNTTIYIPQHPSHIVDAKDLLAPVRKETATMANNRSPIVVFEAPYQQYESVPFIVIANNNCYIQDDPQIADFAYHFYDKGINTCKFRIALRYLEQRRGADISNTVLAL